MTRLLFGCLFFALCTPVIAVAQEVHQDLAGVLRAEVVDILSERERSIIGTDATATVQTVRAVLLEGEDRGKHVEFQNDFVILEPHDRIFLNHLVLIDGSEYYEFKDYDRRVTLAVLALVFVAILIGVAGRSGARALVSLLGSIVVIMYVLVPLLLAGYSPVATSVAVAGVILASAIFITHGVTASSVIAFLGTLGAVVVTGAASYVWVGAAKLTGFASDASVYLNFSTSGALDFSGLLLGSIMIGALGVLDDIAVTQSLITRELVVANPTLSRRETYARALRVGRGHIGSLVNTLALAYVGVSLPLVLLFARTEASIGSLINQEIIAAELVRILVGSIGLILAVPFTTGIAAWWFGSRKPTPGDDASSGHHHAHV